VVKYLYLVYQINNYLFLKTDARCFIVVYIVQSRKMASCFYDARCFYYFIYKQLKPKS